MSNKKSPVRKRFSRIENPAVAEVFASYPEDLRPRLLSLRQIILDTAAETPGVGKIEETLKWSEPAYLTSETRSGSTIRINRKPRNDSKYSMYFNCNTTLVDSFRTLFAKSFRFVGNREIEFDLQDKINAKELQMCISMALTYHLKK
jgi:hypothetical protein